MAGARARPPALLLAGVVDGGGKKNARGC